MRFLSLEVYRFSPQLWKNLCVVPTAGLEPAPNRLRVEYATLTLHGLVGTDVLALASVKFSLWVD